MRRQLLRGLAACAFSLIATPLLAQNWPSRPIKWLVPYQPGSAPDIVARVYAESVSEILKQPIIIDNKPGAGGNVGAQMARRAAPDGYTWFYSGSPMAANMRLYSAPGFDALKDFTHVTVLVSADSTLVVDARSDIRTVSDLVARLRAKPDALSYGSGGLGTPSHLGAELILQAANAKAVHVPYKGAASTIVAVQAGEVAFSLPITGVALPQIQAGKLRALAVTGPRRHPLLPQVPTLVEAGFPGIALVAIGGVSVPAGTPANVVAQINAAMREAAERPAVRAKLEAAGYDIRTNTPAQFTAELTDEIAITERMMRAARLEPQ